MMKKLLEVLQKILRGLVHPIESYRCLVSILRPIMMDGAVSIETAFKYQTSDKNKLYWFRTTIQLDGDIINIVPESNPDDSDWQKEFQSAYRMHQEKVKNFVSQLEGLRIIAWMTGAIISAIATTFSWKLGPLKIWGYASDWVYLSVWPILAYITRKYVLRTILWMTIRVGAWWNKKRLGFA